MKRRVLRTNRNRKVLRAALSARPGTRPPYSVVVDASFLRAICGTKDQDAGSMRSHIEAAVGEQCQMSCAKETYDAAAPYVVNEAVWNDVEVVVQGPDAPNQPRNEKKAAVALWKEANSRSFTMLATVHHDVKNAVPRGNILLRVTQNPTAVWVEHSSSEPRRKHGKEPPSRPAAQLSQADTAFLKSLNIAAPQSAPTKRVAPTEGPATVNKVVRRPKPKGQNPLSTKKRTVKEVVRAAKK